MRDASKVLAVERLLAEAEPMLRTITQTAATFFQTLPLPKAGDNARVPLAPETFVTRMRAPMFALDDALDALASFCKRQVDVSESVAQLSRRADQIRDAVAIISEGGSGDQVTWTLARGRSVSLGASPIEIGGILRDGLFARGGAVIMTSATLSTGQSFEYQKTRLGLPDDTEELLLASPFEYEEQAALYLPEALPDPRSPEFMKRAEQEIAGLISITGGGAFVLCTSLRAMRELCERLRPSLSQRVLMQGEAPSATLLEQFRADGNAVLFATSSFWQGVDVPGDALRLVIIDKLPFDVPTDPLI